MKTRIAVCVVIFFVAPMLFLITPSFSAEPKKLAILPFTMNSDRDLNFLREGIMDMLSSRLAWKDKLYILEKGVVKKAVSAVPGPMNEANALQIGKVLGSEYGGVKGKRELKVNKII